MQLALSAAENEFRRRVQVFFEQEYPKSVLEKCRRGQRLTRDDHVLAQTALAKQGWLGFVWPAEHGGAGFTAVERYIFEEELELAGAPPIIPMGVIYIGPIICAFGTPEQQRQWLPDILSSKSFWAQGYSEPESGSDLASLRTRAVRDGDDYIVNGSKIWTTLAHWADWIFCLVRTSTEARKQEGITMLCIDMHTPGIEVHPIIAMDGSHELNRVSFTDVRVPAANRIGDEGRGWFYANELLKHERLSYAHLGRKKLELAQLRGLLEALPAGPEHAALRLRLAGCEMETATLEMFVLRILTGGGTPATISALKILATELAQKIISLFLDISGPAVRPMPARHQADWHDSVPLSPGFAAPAIGAYLFERAQTIYGGTTEVQKTIITRTLLA